MARGRQAPVEGGDLLRYVLGAYTRYNYRRAAIINAANSWYKVHNLAACFSKLGCTGVHVYIYEATPASDLVVFSPTEASGKSWALRRSFPSPS
jgi:hypothetical protein